MLEVTEWTFVTYLFIKVLKMFELSDGENPGARRKTIMQKQLQQTGQTKAIAIDEREMLLRYRLIQLLALLLSLATALGIYQIFIR